MREADDEHRETEGARTALVPVVNDLEREPETVEAEIRPEAAQHRTPARIPLAPWVVAVSALILASTLLLMLAEAQRTSGRSAALRSIPTPQVTATLAPTPSPTAMEGFQYYTDRPNLFQIQYPTGWVTDPVTPGIAFSDDDNQTGYQVQVVLSPDWSSIGSITDPSDASAYVNLALDKITQRLPQGSYMRVMGSAPITIEGTP
ncbi:MAG TPA: PsbP-related protein, partial [Ktedonobacterales bacterium]|nr:PsbP-related protein [Ktedonobacterales bacterium]